MRHLKLPNAFSLLQSKRKWVLAYVFNSKTLIFKKSVYKDLLHKIICLYSCFSAKLNEEIFLIKIWFQIFKKKGSSEFYFQPSRIIDSNTFCALCNPLLSFFGKVAIFFQKQNCNKKYLQLKMPASLCALLLDLAVT